MFTLSAVRTFVGLAYVPLRQLQSAYWVSCSVTYKSHAPVLHYCSSSSECTQCFDGFFHCLLKHPCQVKEFVRPACLHEGFLIVQCAVFMMVVHAIERILSCFIQ